MRPDSDLACVRVSGPGVGAARPRLGPHRLERQRMR